MRKEQRNREDKINKSKWEELERWNEEFGSN